MSNRFDLTAFLREFDAIINPPALRQIRQVLASVAAQVAPIVQQIQESSRAIAFSPGFVNTMQTLEALRPVAFEFARNFENYIKWVDEAPAKLKEAFAHAGVIPHPSLSWPDTQRLIREFEANGADTAVAQLLVLHEELLTDADFRHELQSRWESVGRWAVMSDVLGALDGGLYFAAVATAIVQAEGLVAQTFGLRGRVAQKALLDKLSRMHASDDGHSLYAPLADAVSRGFFGEFWHGEPIVGLGRHAIAHGADVSYGTRPNAIAVIVWVDYLLILTATDGVRAAVFRSTSLAWFRST